MTDVTDVFISYSRKNVDFVRHLYQELEAVGKASWVDWDSIPLSVDWWNEIRDGIEKSDAFLCVMTPDSLSSHVCHAEIAYAFSRSKRVIPILLASIDDQQQIFNTLEAVQPDANATSRLNGLDPMAAAQDNWQQLSRLNWAMFQNEDQFTDQFQELCKILDIDLEHVKAHTRILVRAREWERARENVSVLMRGAELRDAELWLASALGKDPLPSSLHQRYINDSRTAQIQRQRVQFGAVSAALVIMTVLAISAIVLARLAQNNADLAARRAAESYSLSMASNAQQALDAGNIDLALPLILEAHSIDTPPTRANYVLASVAYSRGTIFKLEGHTLRINGVAYSPDGNSVASGGSDRLLVIWDAHTGQERSRMQFDQPLGTLAYLPDSHHLLISLIQDVALVNLQTQRIEKQFVGHQQLLSALAVDRTGTVMASGDRSGLVILWDVATGMQIKALPPTKVAIKSVSVNEAGTQVLVASADGTLALWDIAAGTEIRHWQASRNPLEAVRFSPDGQSVLAVGDENAITFWDVQTGKERWRRESGSTANEYFSLAFSPDGRFAVVVGNDQAVQLWDVTVGQRLTTMAGHTGWISSVDFSPDGKFVVTGAWDTTVRLWQVASYNELTRFDTTGHTPSISALADDGKTILIGTDEGVILDLDLQSGRTARQFTGHTDKVTSIAVSHDGQFVLSGANDGSLRWWDRRTGKELRRHELSKDSIVTAVTLTPDDKQAIFFFCEFHDVAISCNGKVWSIDTWAELRDLHDENLDTVTAVRLSPAGNYVAAAFSGPSETRDLFNTEGGILLWDFATGKLLKRVFGHSAFMYSLVFSADGRSLLTASQDRTAAMWDVATLTVTHRFEGHLDYVYTADFSPDGQYIITAGRDAQIILWDRKLGSKIMTFTGHLGAVVDAFFLKGTQRLISVGRDGSVRTWQLPLAGTELLPWTLSHHYIRELSCAERDQYAMLLVCDAAGQAPTRTPWVGLPSDGTYPPSQPVATAAVVQVPSAVPPTLTLTPTEVIFPTVDPAPIVSEIEIATSLTGLNFTPYFSRGTPHWQLSKIFAADAKDVFNADSQEKVIGKVLAFHYTNSAQVIKILQYQTAFADVHELAIKNLSISKTIPGVAEYFTLHGIDVLDFNTKALTGDTTRYFIFVANSVEVTIVSDVADVNVQIVKELIEALLTEKVVVPTLAPSPTFGFQFPPSPTFKPKK